MRRALFPPRDPPRPLTDFTSARATSRAPFDPVAVQRIFRKHAAGVPNRPTPRQLRDWMNAEVPVPAEYHPAIVDAISKMTGAEMMRFRRSCGASMRGIAHLVHETKAFTDRFVHFVDARSDGGDRRERWDRGYGNMDVLVGR